MLFRNGYAVAITLSSQPAGTVTVTTTVDDASGGTPLHSKGMGK